MKTTRLMQRSSSPLGLNIIQQQKNEAYVLRKDGQMDRMTRRIRCISLMKGHPKENGYSKRAERKEALANHSQSHMKNSKSPFQSRNNKQSYLLTKKDVLTQTHSTFYKTTDNLTKSIVKTQTASYTSSSKENNTSFNRIYNHLDCFEECHYNIVKAIQKEKAKERKIKDFLDYETNIEDQSIITNGNASPIIKY